MEDKKKKNVFQQDQKKSLKKNNEIHFKNPINEFINQILKYNPIDPLHTLYRKFIELLNLTEQEKELQ
ncbi:MAG: hypothetical protein ACFFAS_03915 [Promethearchaeota archaeon]